MKKYVIIPFYIVLFLLSFTVHGQEQLQPLEEKLEDSSLTTEERLTLYDDLSWEYLNYNFEKSVSYARQGIELARKDANVNMETRLIRNLGVAYYMNQMYEQAADQYDRAMALAITNKDESMQAAIYFAIANMHNATNNYNKAVENYIKAIELFEKTNNKARIIVAKANMCSMYIGMRNYAVAEPLAKEVIALAEEAGDEFTIGQGYNHLMIIYYAQEKDDECLKYAHKALETYKRLDYPLEVFTAMIQVGRVYVRQGKTSEALDFVRQALGVAEQTGYGQYIVEAKEMLARVMLTDGKNMQNAENLALEALQEADTTDYRMMVNLSDLLLKIYIKRGNGTLANEYEQQKHHWLHKIYETDLANAAREMDIKYETEKKEARIVYLSEERKLYFILAIVGGSGVILLIITLLLFNRYQQLKRLRIQEQVEKLKQEKRLVAASSLLDGENCERGRLSRELHDGLGGLLTMVRLDLTQVKKSISNESQKLEEAITLMDKSIIEMRRLAHNLMPESLARFGLKPVLEEFCKGSERVNFHFYGEERRYDEKIQVNFYRIACELINNALKHSDATEINVQLILSPEKLSLTVSDNGRGMGDAEAKEGLTTVRSRVELLGANMNIYSQPGKGSEITIELTVKQ
ncbi:tetratricopeptide repeat-containing sensor histidine kinase [Phocaeicola sp.]